MSQHTPPTFGQRGVVLFDFKQPCKNTCVFSITVNRMKPSLSPTSIDRARRNQEVRFPPDLDPESVEVPDDLCLIPVWVNGILKEYWLVRMPGTEATTDSTNQTNPP